MQASVPFSSALFSFPPFSSVGYSACLTQSSPALVQDLTGCVVVVLTDSIGVAGCSGDRVAGCLSVITSFPSAWEFWVEPVVPLFVSRRQRKLAWAKVRSPSEGTSSQSDDELMILRRSIYLAHGWLQPIAERDQGQIAACRSGRCP